LAIAVPDGEIDILARKIDVMKSGADAQVDPGMGFGKPAQAMHQPFGCKIGRRAHRERTSGLALEQPFGAGGYPVKGIANDLEIGATRLGDDKTLALAVEELQG
jgi:hypothetical protein